MFGGSITLAHVVEPSKYPTWGYAHLVRRDESLKADAAKQKCAELMAAGYGLPAADALSMLGDAHSTNWAENYQFFVNRNNPANFERIWKQEGLKVPPRQPKRSRIWRNPTGASLSTPSVSPILKPS